MKQLVSKASQPLNKMKNMNNVKPDNEAENRKYEAVSIQLHKSSILCLHRNSSVHPLFITRN